MAKRTEEMQKISEMIENLQLEPYKKRVLQDRYLSLLDNFQIRANRLSCMFYTSRVIMTVGSILVPAFLSIQNSSYQTQIYWVTWIISILVTLCNGLMTLFKLDKKYYFIYTSFELLKSEGWQYMGLSGRYYPKDAPTVPTHENQFLAFFHMTEKIKMRQVEEEYWKFTDTSGISNTASHNSMAPTQTPDIKQGVLAAFPTEKRKVLEGWLDDLEASAKPIVLEPRVDGKNPPTVSKTPNESNLPV
jgi:hypothetical protein